MIIQVKVNNGDKDILAQKLRIGLGKLGRSIKVVIR